MPTETPVIVNQEYLQDIADAIRGKNGSIDTYTPAEMAAAISNIPTGVTDPYSYFSASRVSMAARYGLSATTTSTSSSTNYLKGIYKTYGASDEIKSDLINHPFMIGTKTYSSPNYFYYWFIWTPDGYQYCKMNNKNMWRPSYIITPNSLSDNGIPLSCFPGENGINVSDETLVLSMSDFAESTTLPAGPYSPDATATPQITLYRSVYGNPWSKHKNTKFLYGGQFLNILYH